MDNFNLNLNHAYSMTTKIDKTSAEYYIDDRKIAVVNYDEKDVPQKGFFGFATYDNTKKVTVNNVMIRSI